MAERIILNDLENPEFELQLPNGEVKRYELWDLIDKVQEIESKGKPSTIKEQVSAIRKIFGFPDEENSSTFTLSRNQAIALNKKFAEIIAEKFSNEKKAQGSNVR